MTLGTVQPVTMKDVALIRESHAQANAQHHSLPNLHPNTWWHCQRDCSIQNLQDHKINGNYSNDRPNKITRRVCRQL